MEAKDLVVVIPAYEPDLSLLDLVDELNQYFESHRILIIDDGSKNKDIFLKVIEKDNVHILTHNRNQGKGASLKTAFRYIFNMGGSYVIVCADADRKHRVKKAKINTLFLILFLKLEVFYMRPYKYGHIISRLIPLRLAGHIIVDATSVDLHALKGDILYFVLGIVARGDRHIRLCTIVADIAESDVLDTETW